jgi:hypothetical protein
MRVSRVVVPYTPQFLHTPDTLPVYVIIRQYTSVWCGGKLLVHREESNYCRVLRITRVSSDHREMDRNLSVSLLFRKGDSPGHSCRFFPRDGTCGNRVTEGQEDPRLTGKTHVFNSTYNADQKSSKQLTMTIRNRHTPTTFTSM